MLSPGFESASWVSRGDRSRLVVDQVVEIGGVRCHHFGIQDDIDVPICVVDHGERRDCAGFHAELRSYAVRLCKAKPGRPDQVRQYPDVHPVRFFYYTATMPAFCL